MRTVFRSCGRAAAAAVSRANIMNGSSSNGKLLNPQATMTRTEVMTVIGCRRLPRGYAVAVSA